MTEKDAFALASKASRRQMLRRRVEKKANSREPNEAKHDKYNPHEGITQILPTPLDPYEEKRLFATRTVRGIMHSPRRNRDERRPYGVSPDQIDNNIPLATYDVDHGTKKTISSEVIDSNQSYSSAFKSKKNRFASTPTYKMGSFASVVKEPYANPEEIGPGTYRLRQNTLRIKGILDTNYTFSSTTNRFETPKMYSDGAGGEIPVASSVSKQVGGKLSQTPRFKSDTAFPENYPSSKNQRIFSPPDIVYEKPILRNTIKETVATSHIKYGAMTSTTDRLVSAASMIHNVPGAPKLHAATNEAIGPGTYKRSTQYKTEPKNTPFIPVIPTEHTKDRFGMKANNKGGGFVETRFRRFCTS